MYTTLMSRGETGEWTNGPTDGQSRRDGPKTKIVVRQTTKKLGGGTHHKSRPTHGLPPVTDQRS